jgi:hypothetical protein
MTNGTVITQVLAAEWNDTLSFSAEELTQVAPLLLNSGGAAWAWRQVRQTDLKHTPAAHDLHQAYRLHALQVAVKEREIADVFAALRARGLEPLLGKGWAIARHYPEPGLRPFGDIDLYVRREQYDDFCTALLEGVAGGWAVDLHNGAAELDDRHFDDLYAHSQLVSVAGGAARILGPEDNLRLLCLHFLREGALRPLWLCDIAIALDTLPSEFDWNYFFSGEPRRSQWVVATLVLAHELLGVSLARVPPAVQTARLPRWLVPTVLKLWGQGKVTKGRRKRMANYLRQPTGVLKALRERWPNAIEATVGTRGPFNNWPRWPFQVGECVVRTATFACQMPKLIGKY